MKPPLICKRVMMRKTAIKSVVHWQMRFHLLGEYLSEDKSTSNNLIAKEIDDNGVLELAFELPSNYNNSSADALGNGIHAYLVDMALGDWFAITNPEDAASYVQHSAISLENVKRALYKRSRPERPTYS